MPSIPTARPSGLGAIFMVLFVDLVGFSIIFPLFGHMLDYYTRHDAGLLAWAMAHVDQWFPGADRWQRAALFGGLIGACYSALQFIAAPFWGRLSDRIGRRPVLLTSCAGNTCAYLIWIVADDFTVLLVSRLLAGLMTGNVAAANAAVADISTPQTRARGMGMLGMAFGLGFILGPTIGGLSHGLLPRLDQIPALAALGANEFSTPAAVAFLLSAVNLGWIALRFRETLPPERRTRADEGGRTANPLTLLSPRFGVRVAMLNAAFLLHTLLFAGMEATLVFLAAQRCGFTPMDNAWLFAWMALVSAAIQGGVYRRLSPRIDQRTLALAGFAILMPGFLLIAAVDWFPSTALLVTGLGVLGIGTGLVFPALNTLVSLGVDERTQGWALGQFRSAGALGRAVGPLLAAILYFRFAPSAPYVLGAVGTVLPLLLVLRLAAPAKAAGGVPEEA
jgi:MFS family permease